MSAAEYNFSIEQGSSYKLAIVYKNCYEDPVDITDWCARITVYNNRGDTLIFTTNNTDDSEYKMYIDGTEGKLTLLLPAEKTNEFTWKLATYDLELESPDDFYSGGGKYIIKLLYGKITILDRESNSNTLLNCQS